MPRSRRWKWGSDDALALARPRPHRDALPRDVRLALGLARLGLRVGMVPVRARGRCSRP